MHSTATEFFPWTDTLCRMIRAVRPAPFTGSTVMVYSDYGGEHPAAKYATYSFLALDTETSLGWLPRRGAVRSLHLPDGRRLSYKGLRDRRQWRALTPFLSAANHIDGLLLTVAVRHYSDFDPFGSESMSRGLAQFGQALGVCAPHELRKMARVAHLLAVVVATLTQSRHHIYWISDEDSTQANSSKQADFMKALNACLGLHGVGQPAEFGIGTTAIDPGDRHDEDLASVADLCAGAVCDVFGILNEACGGTVPVHVAVRPHRDLPAKTGVIWDWLVESPGRLKKVVALIERRGDGLYTVGRFAG